MQPTASPVGTATVLDPWSDSADAMLTALEGLGRALRGRLTMAGLEGGGMLSLLRVLDRIGPARTTELAARTRLDTSTVSRHAQRLEQRGWLSRRPDPDDGRAQRLDLTAAGRAELAAVHTSGVALFRALLAEWDENDVTALTRLLSRLNDGLPQMSPETASLSDEVIFDATKPSDATYS